MQKLQRYLVTTGGILCLLFGVFHLCFWKLLNWEQELTKLSVDNSNVMQMLNYSLCVLLLSFAYLLIFKRNEIIHTAIGKSILIIISIFMFARLIMEFIFPGGSLILGALLLVFVFIYLIPALIKN